MKPMLICAAWLSLCLSQNSHAIESPVLGIDHPHPYPIVVRAYDVAPEQLQFIADHADLWSINRTQQFAVVQVANEATFQRLLTLNLTMRLDQPLMQQLAADRKRLSSTNKAGSGIPGFACYGTVAETFQRMDQMVANHPNLAAIADIGDSWEKVQNGAQGEDLRVLVLTNQSIPGDKPIMFAASAIHAREYTTAELNTRFAEHLLAQYGTDPDVTWILDHHEIHLSLITNPDGRKQAQTGILWRKNTNNNHCPNSDSRGVDLNRNYPFEWGIGGSNSACSETFIGPSGESEPEIMAQMDYIRTIFDDNRGNGANDPAPADTPGLFIDIHSFSQLVLWPWGYTSSNSANDNQFQALGKRTAFFNGYRPQPVNDLVITGGGSIDAAYGELGVASLAFELGTSFFQDCDTFENQIYPDNLDALLYLARVTQAPYIQPLGPDIEDLLVIPNVVVGDTTAQVTGVADDDRYNQSNGSQAVGSVQAVTAYVNELPIQATGGQALSPTDGQFNSSREAFSGQVTTNGLNPGQNLLYVQAHDGSQPGATFARFIDVVEPQNVARLTGTVRNALTGVPVSGALLSINQSQALSAVNGGYVQYVQPGTADLQVSAAEFAPFTLSSLNLTAGSDNQEDIWLQPFCDLLNDDVESGNIGWQAQSPWAISTDRSVSPTHAWTDSPGGDYANNRNVALTSPLLDVADADSVAISYQSWCDTEATFDFGYFEVQYNGGSWQTISRCDNQANWQRVTHPMTLPAGTLNMRFRFRLETDGFVTEDGWHLDDIQVKVSGPVCGEVFDDIIFADNFDS
ncbi:M14 family zinc carboxypeptidase [Marinicella meishanensis]|uniref:M14 family zinc carboxypeptidase n=1 Tax=Marinicella meishanensis TaxID=2873263 RepID=UPI001CC0208D|nr:M14 family zinc carboxypeptidase [Marinicella sp. NBU2979]